jgi:hypothetical protein
MEIMELFELIYPHMREELIAGLRGLSDRGYQERVWVRGEQVDGVVHDEFDYVIHFIFDDTSLASDAASCIGWFLLDEQEADSIQELVQTLSSLFEIYGLDLADSEYMAVPQWERVIGAAKNTMVLLMEKK